VAASYDSWFDLPLGRTVDALEKQLLYDLAMPRDGERALDVGTGTGHFASDLAAQGLAVVGVDLSRTMLAVAQGKRPPLQLVRGDAAALPLASASFDLVVSVTALEFVASPEDMVAQMWRVVSPGGRLVIGVLNAWSPWAWVRRKEARREQTPFSNAHFFCAWELSRLLAPLGRVTWSSSVFVGPHGAGQSCAWGLERIGRMLLKPFGALLVARVSKQPSPGADSVTHDAGRQSAANA